MARVENYPGFIFIKKKIVQNLKFNKNSRIMTELRKCKDFKGKVVLVVNTATGCGFTPHYKDFAEMYSKFHEQGFEIVDVPCNQFVGQTPGNDEEIHEFCQLKYHTEFPQRKKADVNGDTAIAFANGMRPFL